MTAPLACHGDTSALADDLAALLQHCDCSVIAVLGILTTAIGLLLASLPDAQAAHRMADLVDAQIRRHAGLLQ